MVLKNANKLNSSVTTVRKTTTTTTTSASSAGRQTAGRKEVPAAGSSSVASPVSPDIHSHCENCINVSTCKDSSCPIVPCDCGHKLHQCKLQDHALLCREANFKVREALLSRVCGSYRTQGFARCLIKPLWNSEATVSNSMSSPSHLGTGCASQDFLPTSTPPTSPLDLSSPSHSTTNSNTPCAGKRFLLDDAEMDVLEALAKDNPDLLTHGVNLDIEETITCSPEDETPPGLQDSDMMSPTSEHVGPPNMSERDSIPSVEIFCVESDETQRRTDSLVELGENIVAEAVQLAKATVEDMLRLKREQASSQHESERSLSSSKSDGKALEQKQTSELLDSLMKETPKPATRYSLAGDDADSPSDEPDNNEPDSEQLLDDASLSQHGPDEPETISEESSSCLEPIRIQAAKSPTLEDIPDLPDDQEKHKVIHEVPETENDSDDNQHHRRRDTRSRGNKRNDKDEDDDEEDSQNSDTESHSPSSEVRYHCTGTVVRKVKKTETTTTSSKMTAGTEGAPAPANKPCTLQQPDPHASSDENSNSNSNFNKECNISLARLKDSYVTIAENGLGRDGVFKETAVTGVSLSSLKQSYVQNACNGGGGPLSLPPERTLRARENIPTIDIGRLKNAYNSLGHSEITKAQSPDDLVPVDINALRENFSRQQSIHAAREPSPVEEVKLSVDKKKVQSQFSVDGGEVDSKCKRCQKTVYPAERVRAEKAQYHKQCFRCKECSKTLSAESYNSHEGELYCANHFKQLFQPKANFEVDSGPKGQDLLSGCDELDHDGKQRKHEMIIRENEPMQLSPDVVRCDTRSNMEDLEGLNLNLGSLKSRFENQQKPEDDVKKSTSVADRSALSRSASVLKRLEKYQSVASGEAKADSSDEEGEDEMDKIDLSKKIEVCREMNELKNKWESGKVSKEHREPAKDELASLRKKICVGRSESMKVVYEKAVQEANTADSKKNAAPDDLAVTHAFATNLKKKFETGEVIKEQEAERLEYVRSEKEEDLSVCQETGIAHQAKNMFKQLDKEITSRPQAQTPTPIARTPSESRWNRSPGDPNKNIEIVKASEPGQKDHIEVETTALTERFKFFQNYKEEPTSKKDFRMTPPRELEKENSPAPACERDPNVVVSSSVIDDIPKVDTATKMRQKFQELIESPADKSLSSVETSRPKALKRITPPRETFEDNVVENTPVVDPNVIKCSYKVDDDIQVEADKTKSMKARFENWSDVEQRKNSANLDDDCLPVDNITRNMRAMFETNSNQGVQTNGQTAERNKPKVNRFVFGAGSEICAMCQGKVFPMERREASGLVMHTKCFKCTHCNINLRLDGYSQTGGKLYCEAHYQQLFKVKGNYDEGFGREKWSRTPSPSSQDTPPLNLPPTSSNHTVIA